MKARSSILMALAGGVMLWLASSAVPQEAQAQCCAPPPPPPPCCTAPPPPCCAPPPPPPRPTHPICCTPGHNVNIPGVNVVVSSIVVNANVSASAVANANAAAGSNSGANSGANAGAGAGAFGQAGAIFFGGGGGGGGFVPPSPTAVITGLNVEGGLRKKRVSFEATRTKYKRVVIQAVCLDDRDVPHPASQITPDRDIEAIYEGELYRCIAGSRMQVTIAEYNGQIAFDGGQTMACRKGESLWHGPGPEGGKLECRPAKPGRDCYERSLLRRYGAGVKILVIVTTETYTDYREEVVREESSSSATFTMSLDGGVGGIVY